MFFAHGARILAIIWRNGGRYWSLAYYLATLAILHKGDIARTIVSLHPNGGRRLVRTLFDMSPVWALLPLTILIVVAFYREILSLERHIAPRLVVGTTPKEKCLVTARHAHGGVEAMARILRLQVVNPSAILIKGCRAYLVDVRRQDGADSAPPLAYGDSLPLEWSSREGESQIDLPGQVPQYINLLYAQEGDGKLRLLRAAVPQRYDDLFDRTGSYRLRVAVAAEGMPTETIELAVDWPGRWSGLDLIDPAPVSEPAASAFRFGVRRKARA